MKNIIDKIQAMWIVLISKEYAVYTCDSFYNPSTGKCWLSYGIDKKHEGYKTFLETINDYNKTL